MKANMRRMAPPAQSRHLHAHTPSAIAHYARGVGAAAQQMPVVLTPAGSASPVGSMPKKGAFADLDQFYASDEESEDEEGEDEESEEEKEEKGASGHEREAQPEESEEDDEEESEGEDGGLLRHS
ncbi:hypothetical protein EWM64_g10317 [Hericium alpestre]|uniref:Uncharacterized protein n=1 Tax=Hericium alpestre TaxID=135208 RepID=A0A4Y9ZG29_9AGAM|nr:hypothetical protein EWM64_g10317 [Hericium alpestre]